MPRPGGRAGGQVGDVGVGEIGGLDPPGCTGFGEQPADATGEGVDFRSGITFPRPAVPQHRVGAGVSGAAEGEPVGEQIPHGRVDDLVGGALGGEDDDDPGGAATGDQVAGEGGELLSLGLGADGGGEVGVLVDEDEVDALPGLAGDLAGAVGQERVVAGVHRLLEGFERGDGVGDGRADEHVGAVPPGAKLDLLAVDEDEVAVG
jgi:hypothetical protein